MTCDILEGSIADSTSLNQFTFVNGNPVSFVNPFGLSAERATSNRKKDWIGAAYLERQSIVTMDEKIDLTFGFKLVHISHVQTVTTTQTHGVEGEWLGAYSYIDYNIDGASANYGVGISMLNGLGVDVNVKLLGLEATLSVKQDTIQLYFNAELNVFSESSAGIGIVNFLPNGDEVNDQFSINGDTGAVLAVVGSIGQPHTEGEVCPFAARVDSHGIGFPLSTPLPLDTASNYPRKRISANPRKS